MGIMFVANPTVIQWQLWGGLTSEGGVSSEWGLDNCLNYDEESIDVSLESQLGCPHPQEEPKW
jgi:hypothetical protein